MNVGNSPFARINNSVLAVCRDALRQNFKFDTPDISRLLIWLPVGLAIGISAYFALPEEPGLIWSRITLMLALLCLGLAWIVRRSDILVFSSIIIASSLVGFAHIQLRAHSLVYQTPELSKRAVEVTGWIEAIEKGGNRPRLRLRVLQLEGWDNPPEKVTLLSDLDGFKPGDSIQVKAVLTPPNHPVAPGAYDPARAAWFDQIALTGYSISDLKPGPQIHTHYWARKLAGFRFNMAQTLSEHMNDRTQGLAVALLTGQRWLVESEDKTALQQSGLGHILAISGLHMALLAGGVYGLLRFVFASIDVFARAYDPRKPAAIAAILAASAYLVLSGASVPTQRAWIMAVIVLVGVLLDRRAFSMRSLAIAAIMVLIIAPHSVIEVGFQMSFAAVAALIAVYEFLQKKRTRRSYPQGVISRLTEGIIGLSTTSLVAGLATGVFAAFHFQRMASFGLLANLLAMPVFTFWVMPVGVMALGLMPFGLEGLALTFMEPGLELILDIAHWTTNLKGARFEIQATQGSILALYGLGFTLLTLGMRLSRALGGMMAISALALWSAQPKPDLMVTDKGVVIARFEPGISAFQASSLRSRFDTTVMIQRAGGGADRPARANLHCDHLGCTGQTQDGVIIAITDQAEALSQDCVNADIIVFKGHVSAWRRRRCTAILLDDTEREGIGGAQFWVSQGKIYDMRAVHALRGSRLWTSPVSVDDI